MQAPRVSGHPGIRTDGHLRARPKPHPSDDNKVSPRRYGSGREQRMRANRELLTATLGGVEKKLSTTRLHAYRGSAQGEIKAHPPDVLDRSPEATAQRILGGIQGAIYGAFSAQHPNASAEDFAEFEEAVRSGFEQGMREARGIIEGLSMLNPELAGAMGRTEELVLEGLESFFSRERAQFQAAA